MTIEWNTVTWYSKLLAVLVFVATFAVDGPLKCSGLDVVRYDEELMRKEIGKGFELIKSCNELHKTPWDSEQKFTYFLFKRNAPSG